jgi:hypothetical protein
MRRKTYIDPKKLLTELDDGRLPGVLFPIGGGRCRRDFGGGEQPEVDSPRYLIARQQALTPSCACRQTCRLETCRPEP